MKRIILQFERGGCFTAILHDHLAPETCQSLWDQIPSESTVTHSRWSGREINFQFQSSRLPPEENQSIYTSIGEIVYWREWNKGIDQNSTEVIAVYYGPEETRSHKGPEPVNVIGQIDYNQLEELKRLGERIWLQGIEKVRLEKCTDY